MSQLWTPGQQQQQGQVTINMMVLPDSSVMLSINGLQVPPLTAETVIDLAGKMTAAAKQAIASRVPVEVPNGSILAAVGQREIAG